MTSRCGSIYPPDFDPARKYPVYMLLHGGPHNGITDGTQWRWNAEVFASWGYITTWHNFHGSSGFGQSFTDSINPDQISMPYEDTIKAAEYLMAKPYVDSARMAAGGGSYGGFLAATLLGRPHPFKTLVAHAAVFDNFTQYAADYGAEKRRFFDYWEKPEEFMRYSPHSNAANFNTPTLVIHGQLDRRVPVEPGLRALQHPADARRAEPARVFPGREPLGAEAAELAVLVPDEEGVAREVHRPLKRTLKDTGGSTWTDGNFSTRVPRCHCSRRVPASSCCADREAAASEAADPRRHALHRPARRRARACARPRGHALQPRQDQYRSRRRMSKCCTAIATASSTR